MPRIAHAVPVRKGLLPESAAIFGVSTIRSLDASLEIGRETRFGENTTF
jgi:hypothetical protein